MIIAKFESFIEDSSSGLIFLKVINNIHLPEFFYFSQAFARLWGVRLQGERITKNGDRYVKCVARIHMKYFINNMIFFKLEFPFI